MFMFLLKVGFIFHRAQGNIAISVTGAGVRAGSTQRCSSWASPSRLGEQARTEPWQGETSHWFLAEDLWERAGGERSGLSGAFSAASI